MQTKAEVKAWFLSKLCRRFDIIVTTLPFGASIPVRSRVQYFQDYMHSMRAQVVITEKAQKGSFHLFMRTHMSSDPDFLRFKRSAEKKGLRFIATPGLKNGVAAYSVRQTLPA